MSAKIIGIGTALPEKIVTNHDLSNLMDTNDEWITSRTGIKQRHFVTNQNTSDLATIAAKQAISDAKLSPQDIDVIIVCTFTPDNFTPSVASMVQKNLGLTHNMMAFDVNGACSGFLIGLEIALGLLNTHKNCLLIGAEVISKMLDFTDRSTAILFGDGAGAVVLTADKSREFNIINRAYPDIDSVLYANGINGDNEKQTIKMNGSEVFRFAVKALSEGIQAMDYESCDLIIPHQANSRIISNVSRSLKIPIEKFYMNLDQVGNTSAASIVIALKQAITEGKLKSKDRVLCVGFGAGLTMGSALFEL